MISAYHMLVVRGTLSKDLVSEVVAPIRRCQDALTLMRQQRYGIPHLKHTALEFH